MMKNAELSCCKECKGPSTAILDDDDEPYCGSCGSYWLLDMSDGIKFVAEFDKE